MAMAKATAGIASRCSGMNVDTADIVIIELLHDEPHSTQEVDRVPGVRCVLTAVCVSTAPCMYMRNSRTRFEHDEPFYASVHMLKDYLELSGNDGCMLGHHPCRIKVR